MSLISIKEPGEQVSSEKKLAIGIDLGTTNSLVSFYELNESKIIKDYLGNKLIPSIVAYDNSGKILIGHEAYEKLLDPNYTVINSVKRFMGKSLNDIKDREKLIGSNDGITFKTLFKNVTPIEISAEILKYLKNMAEDHLKDIVKYAVITVPAYFDDAERQATKDASSLAGLEVLRLVNEPTAAALAYGINQNSQGTYLIYDLGGGTFDVSILNISQGVFQVLATGGDNNIGGDDFDQIIVEDFINSHLDIILSIKEKDYLISKAKNLKEILSSNESGELEIEINSNKFVMSLNRDKFENLINNHVNKTINIVENTLDDYDSNNITAVILVGGSTRIPLIKEKLTSIFGNKLLCDIDPDEVVAIGAGFQAANLTGKISTLLIDVASLSLGLEMMGGIVEKIIERNSALPVSIEKKFTTYLDNQTGMQFHIVQGERELASDCRSLAKFELKNIKPKKSGLTTIIVTFTVDVDGILSVSAKDSETGNIEKITINASYGLSADKIEQMLNDSMKNARLDVTNRLLIETKLGADQVIKKVENILIECESQINNDEKKQFELVLAKLNECLNRDDRSAIITAIEDLEKLYEAINSKKLDNYLNSFIGMNIKNK